MKIVLIAGAGRSGSTILERIMGQIDDFFSLGEVNHIWERSFIENQLCGCGKPFKDCEFWQEITKKFLADLKYDPSYILKLQRSVARLRHLPYLLFPKLRSPKYRYLLNTYMKILEKFYRIVNDTVFHKILIDSSKIPTHAFILNEMGFDLYLIHLVRDSRAVVYSWQRKKKRPEIYWARSYMSQYSIIKATQDWILSNLLVEYLKIKIKQHKTVSYEIFSQFPKTTIINLIKWLQIDFSEKKISFFEDEKVVQLERINHTVSGNPVRFIQGRVEIKTDTEWMYNMSIFKKNIVSILTYPFLIYYKQKFEKSF